MSWRKAFSINTGTTTSLRVNLSIQNVGYYTNLGTVFDIAGNLGILIQHKTSTSVWPTKLPSRITEVQQKFAERY